MKDAGRNDSFPPIADIHPPASPERPLPTHCGHRHFGEYEGMKTLVGLIAATMLCGCHASTSATPNGRPVALAAATPWDAPVTPQGVGVQDRLPRQQEEDDVCCADWRFPGHPGLVAMMTGGLVVRIEVDSPAYRTRSGIRVGISEAEVRALGGRPVALPNRRAAGRYLALRAAGSPYGVLLETDGARAVRMRVGLWAHLTYE